MNLSENDGAPIVLLGFMGSGKSSVARKLAPRLNLPRIDLDARLEEEAGRSIAAIFAQDGEAAFREMETAHLQRALQERGVIATGGGIVTRSENRALLKSASTRGALIVYLRVAPRILAARIRRQPGVRPLIDGERVLNFSETQTRVEEILQVRAPLYESCANLILEGDEMSASQIARVLAERWQQKTP